MSPRPGDDASYRISDAEREAAMAALGRAFAEGRLALDEYDERVRGVAEARTRGDIEPLFRDLPTGRDLAAYGGGGPEKLYSASEIDAVHRHGTRVKAGLLGISVLGSIAATVALSAVVSSSLSMLALLVVPLVWLLLYVMQAGPDSWHVPSPAAVERRRLRELKTAEKLRRAEQRALEAERLADLRLERRVRTEELTSRALGMVNRALDPDAKKPWQRPGGGPGTGDAGPGSDDDGHGSRDDDGARDA